MGKYWAVFRLSVLLSLKNYKGLLGLSIFLVTCLLVFAHLWKVAALKLGVDHLDPNRLLWYIALNEWVLIAIPDQQLEIERDCSSGRLAYLLPRPISYIGMSFCEGLGVLTVNLGILGLVSFLFTWWMSGSFPFDVWSLSVVLFLGILSGILAMLFKMLVGVSAFWLDQVDPFDWIWEKMLFALGGLILPLSAYPVMIQKIAAWTPFPVILGQRSALALDFTYSAALQTGLTLLLWGIFSVSLLLFLYRRGLRILNLEGG